MLCYVANTSPMSKTSDRAWKVLLLIKSSRRNWVIVIDQIWDFVTRGTLEHRTANPPPDVDHWYVPRNAILTSLFPTTQGYVIASHRRIPDKSLDDDRFIVRVLKIVLLPFSSPNSRTVSIGKLVSLGLSERFCNRWMPSSVGLQFHECIGSVLRLWGPSLLLWFQRTCMGRISITPWPWHGICKSSPPLLQPCKSKGSFFSSRLMLTMLISLVIASAGMSFPHTQLAPAVPVANVINSS